MSKSEDILRRMAAGSAVLLLLAAGAFGASFFVSVGVSRTLMLSMAATFATILLAAVLLRRWFVWRAWRRRDAVTAVIAQDGAPAFCTDDDGVILARNGAAIERFGSGAAGPIDATLESLLANPDAIVERLRTAASSGKVAREDVVTRGGDVRLSVHRVPSGLLWRVEELGERKTRGAEQAGLPMLTFGPSGTILYMNEALRTATGQRTRRMTDLFTTVPLQNGGLNHLTTSEGIERVRVILSAAGDGRYDAFVIPAGDEVDARIAFDDLPVALLRLDGDGRVIFANRLARELLPALDSPKETRLAAMVEGLGRSVREWVGEAAAGRGLYRAEVVRVTGAEIETYLQVTLGRPLDDSDGGLLAVLNDATELKTMEAQFVQSQKMQAIGQLAGGVAHDFNNLLTAISGHCDLLLLRHEENDEDFADLTQITHNANRAAALVGQLLAFSRKQTLEMQPIDLRDALGDLAHLLNRLVGERVTLRLEHDPALIPIRGDRRQLEQVLMNLVVNARDAMPQGGEVLIETRCRYLDTAMTRDRVTVPPGQYVVVDVSDQGCGISPDNLSRIFEPFFTTKRPGEGTGLGLSMAYGIVKQSGGYIFADSTVGGGTRFSLFFPAMTEDAELAFDEAEASRSGSLGDGSHTADHARPYGDTAASNGEDRTETHASARDVSDDVGPAGGNRSDPVASSDQATLDNAGAPGEVDPSDGHDAPPERDAAGELDRIKAALASAGIGQTSAVDPAAIDGENQPARDGSDEVPANADGPAVVSGPVPSPRDGAEVGAPEPDAPYKPVVLLVEDEAPVRAFASRALRLRGYRVMEAENAESALEQLADASLSVDLFVTDVMMPGLDGPSWVREALKARPHVRTVFISGYTQDALSETSQPVPNAVFLPKPFSLSDLTRTVEKALL